MQTISYLILPLIIAMTGVAILFSKKDLFSEFIEGAKDGLQTGLRLLPTLVALVTAVTMFNASGAADTIAELLEPVFNRIGIPSALTPLIIIRPISGGAATAVINSLLEKYGPDSFIGRCTSVIAGSSDTLIYIAAVYFAAANVKKSRHALPAAFLTMLFCIVFSCLVTRFFFGE